MQQETLTVVLMNERGDLFRLFLFATEKHRTFPKHGVDRL